MSDQNQKIFQDRLLAKEKFFQSCVNILKKRAWGASLLSQVNRDCEFLENYHLALFPDGMGQILSEFENYLNIKMISMLGADKIPEKIREKIARALFVRITKILSKEALMNHAAYMALPHGSMIAIENICKGCDAIWRFAGDQSTDFNYYTKRGLLMPIYISAHSYYLADESDDFQDTQNFINSSLEKVIKISTLKSKIKIPNIENIPFFRMFC